MKREDVKREASHFCGGILKEIARFTSSRFTFQLHLHVSLAVGAFEEAAEG